MLKQKNILIDFDGTIADTSPGVFDSLNVVIDHYGLKIDKSEYGKFIGPPLKDSFRDILKLPQDEIPTAIKVYRDYYSVKGMFNCEIYDGIVEFVEGIRKSGRKAMIATSKPEVYTKAILEKKGMLDLFDFIGGADLGMKGRLEKIDVLRYILEENKIDASDCLMVGDRKYDVEGAHIANMECMGILWGGFGTVEEFEQAGADYICNTTDDALRMITE